MREAQFTNNPPVRLTAATLRFVTEEDGDFVRTVFTQGGLWHDIPGFPSQKELRFL